MRHDERAVAVPDDFDADTHEDEGRQPHQYLETGRAEQPADRLREAVGEIDTEADGDHAGDGAERVLGQLWYWREAGGLAAADGDRDRHRARSHGERHGERIEAADLAAGRSLRAVDVMLGPLLGAQQLPEIGRASCR